MYFRAGEMAKSKAICCPMYVMTWAQFLRTTWWEEKVSYKLSSDPHMYDMARKQKVKKKKAHGVYLAIIHV